MHLGCLRVRAQEQEGEVIRAERGQQQRSRALEECLLPWQIINVLQNIKGNLTSSTSAPLMFWQARNYTRATF